MPKAIEDWGFGDYLLFIERAEKQMKELEANGDEKAASSWREAIEIAQEALKNFEPRGGGWKRKRRK